MLGSCPGEPDLQASAPATAREGQDLTGGSLRHDERLIRHSGLVAGLGEHRTGDRFPARRRGSRDGLVQLRKAARAARGEFLLAIDQALATPEFQDLRTKIYKSSNPWRLPDSSSKRNEVRRYIAVFERLGILLRDRSVSIRHVDQIYGDRIAAITNNATVRELILDSPDAWRDFLYLWKRIEKRRRRRAEARKPYGLRKARKEAKQRSASPTAGSEIRDRFEVEEAEKTASAAAAPPTGGPLSPPPSD